MNDQNELFKAYNLGEYPEVDSVQFPEEIHVKKPVKFSCKNNKHNLPFFVNIVIM